MNMSSRPDSMEKFRNKYLDYLEGRRGNPPATENLPEEQQPTAQAFIKSITAARGVNPYAERAPLEELLAGKLDT